MKNIFNLKHFLW